MPNLTIELSDMEMQTLKQMVKQEEPENTTVEKYVYLHLLRRMRFFLCGVQQGIDQSIAAFKAGKKEAEAEAGIQQ
jgi:hypothetical protein